VIPILGKKHVPWHPRCLKTPCDIKVHALVSVCCWLFTLAAMWTPTVHADSAAPKSNSARAAPRPGLLTQDRLTAAALSRTEFLMTHGNYAQTRFHLADRINRETVRSLKLGWSFEMDVTESIQTAPIVYDGIMYVTSSFNHLFALDAKTGREL